ncbi:NEL-type E3 ubiquitin ligase domain-containing protein [Pseudomonas sp. NPDC087804]|uniref:NEL-type E3 ubiquitin ligase domain-containing protein n=1 Tax=Pseudomonas sp. NPDC087804 TaxID=3364449 RepID=UPI003823FAA5
MSDSGAQGIHFETLKKAIPSVLIKASAKRRAELRETPSVLPNWFTKATSHQKDDLKAVTEALHLRQNERDALFDKIQDIETFAKKLLEPELHKLDASFDADATWIRLYAPKSLGIFGIKSGGMAVKTLSLLQAALHNFEYEETRPGFYKESSCFISRPDADGHFETINTAVSVDTFARLCRRLNIGEQYQNYLKDFLRPPGNRLVENLLRQINGAYYKQSLHAAALLALIKKDIGKAEYDQLMKVVRGDSVIMDGNKQVRMRGLSIMGLRLTDCVLFIPSEFHRYSTGSLIAWIPDDPEHPIKRYANFQAFEQELTRQLSARPSGDIGPDASKPSAYQMFFSRFVAQKDKPYYFKRFTETISDGPPKTFVEKWRHHELVQLGERLMFHLDIPPPREVGTRQDPLEAPNFDVIDCNLPGKGLWEDFELWPELHEATLNKLINDARTVAVPNADEDAKARAERWANYLNIGFIALGAFALVLPGLGELMLVATAGQMLYEVLEGAVELSEGDREAGWAHLTDVIENLATSIALAPVFHFTVSPFIENLKAIRLPSGKIKLWKPDLEPYRFKGKLAQDIPRDSQGLYQHQDKTLLRVDEHHYELSKQSPTGELIVRHPSRPDAFAIPVKHNGAGSFVLEGETPRNWDNATLMRRLGHTVEPWSDPQQLELIRKTSGTSPDVLRRMYHDNAGLPPLLADTVHRFNIERDVQTFIDNVTSDDPLPQGQARRDPASQLQIIEAQGLWPVEVPLRVSDGRGNTLWQSAAAKVARGKKLVVQLSDQQIAGGQGLHNVMQTLEANGTPITVESEAQLQAHIANTAKGLRNELFNQRYEFDQTPLSPTRQLVKQAFPALPVTMVDTLLGDATPAELDLMSEHQHLPLRLKHLARELQFETRATHAWQGFHHDWLATADTERLALNALRINSDVLAELRIYVRQLSLDGELSCSAGAEDATTVRTLIKDEDFQYRAHDNQGQPLQESSTDLFESILAALPTQQRQTLGYRLNDAAGFKQWVMAKTEPANVRRTLLVEPPVSSVVPRETLVLLGGPGYSRVGETLQQRIQDIYPHLNESEVQGFAQSLTAQGDAEAGIRRIEHDLDTLRIILDTWRFEEVVNFNAGNGGTHNLAFMLDGGAHLSERLIACFERKSVVFGERSVGPSAGFRLDLSSELRRYNLEHWWKKLPDIKPYLEQITSLSLDNVPLVEGPTGLLKDFSHLRELSARNCELKSLPTSIGKMRQLENLRLSGNRIKLTPQSAEELRNLTRLQTLRLDENPLGLTPDVGRMPRLSVLSLNDTGLTTWPKGLFEKHRPRLFFLDMLGNPIEDIPQVAPGSNNAYIVARTRLMANELSDINRLLYEQYRTSVGLIPEHIASATTTDMLRRWPLKTEALFTRIPGLGIYRPEAWPDLASEPNSRGFFKIINDLTQSADYRAGGSALEQLSDRVWRMIHAIDIDKDLRQDLFDMATSPVNCRDAGAQVFNQMGIKVMAAEARLLSTSREVLEQKLVTLARGAARLEQVDDIAQADIQSRGGNPDVVEVYLAYQTGLARRLDLPWQSQNMLFRITAGVDQIKIDSAFETVIAMEAGDGLINRMLEQPFWTNYLRETYPESYYANKARFEEKASQLDDLRTAQDEWASANSTYLEKAALREKIKELAKILRVPKEQVLTRQPMADSMYERLINDLGDQEQQLSRQQTRDALKTAGL